MNGDPRAALSGRRDRRGGRVLQLSHQRPDSDDLGFSRDDAAHSSAPITAKRSMNRSVRPPRSGGRRQTRADGLAISAERPARISSSASAASTAETLPASISATGSASPMSPARRTASRSPASPPRRPRSATAKRSNGSAVLVSFYKGHFPCSIKETGCFLKRPVLYACKNRARFRKNSRRRRTRPGKSGRRPRSGIFSRAGLAQACPSLCGENPRFVLKKRGIRVKSGCLFLISLIKAERKLGRSGRITPFSPRGLPFPPPRGYAREPLRCGVPPSSEP